MVANLKSFKAAACRLILSCALMAAAGWTAMQPAYGADAINRARITAPSGVTDPNASNDQAEDSDLIAVVADLSITKSDGVASVPAGSSTSYTVVVSNAGPSAVAAAAVTDTAPAGLTITSWTCQVSNAGTGSGNTACGAASGAGNINTTADLKNGGILTYTVNATVSGTATGSIANTATIAVPSGATDSNTANNSATDTNTVTPSADLSVTKTDGATSVPAGSTTTYTIAVTNAGPNEVTNATVVDAAPAGLTINNWTCAVTAVGSGGTVTTACGATSGTGNINTTVNMKNGAVITYMVTASVSVSAASPIANTVTVGVPSGTTDPNTGNNNATDSNTVTPPVANLSVTKNDGVSSVPPGGSTVYTIVVSNAGPSEVTNATVIDTAPAGLTIGTWTCAVSNTGSGGTVTTACGAAGGTGNINTTVNMKNGAVITYTVNATVSTSATGSIANQVRVQVPSGTTDPGPDGNTATDTNTVPRTADIAVQKTLTTTGPYVVGQAVAYSIVVTNNGPSQALNVGVSDTPSNLTITGVSGACTALPCTIASINSGTSATITVNGTVGNTPGAFNNTATATVPPTTTDPTPGNNTDDAPATAAESADVSIVKTLTTAGPYFVGQTITYSLTVANAGPSTATSVQVTDTPANLTIQSVSGACTALPCTIASIAAAGSQTITVTATINAAGAFDNSASANAAQSDPNPSNNTDNTGNGGNAAAVADVSVVKTLTTTGPYVIGQVVSFNIVVTNNGLSTATGVQITDTMTNLTQGTVSGACTALPCTIPSIASGDSATITVAGTIQADGAFSNSATATPIESDPVPGNNTSTAGGNTTPTADVSVVKTLTTTGPYVIGQVVSFNIVVTNNGPSAATGVQITDTMTNLTQGTVSGACTALPCTIPSIAATSSATITVTGTIQADGAFSNSATATPTETDPNTGNNTGTAGDNTTPTADVSVVKTLATAGPYLIGQTVSFDIVVSNAGPSVATNVAVSDAPTNLTLGTVTGACTALPCTIASIASGGSATITVTGTIQADGAFSNNATATPAETDPVPGNNTGTAGGNTTPTADVEVAKMLTTAGPYTIGQTVSFDILVSNAGLSTATNVSVSDTPTNLALGVVTGACTALPCSIASIAPGGSATITVTGTILAEGAFINTATATPAETDPNIANNTGSVSGNTTPTADVSVAKTLTTPGPYVVGQAVSYSIAVTNEGPSEAFNVGVSDTPSNLIITSVSGACTALPCIIATLNAGATATITVNGTVGNTPGAFNNTATATAPAAADPNPANNTDDAPATAAESADVSIVKALTTAGPYFVGQTITYSLTVANAGPSTATSVQVTDTPANLTIQSVSGACTALPCTIASIAAAGSQTITVTATINAAGAFDNSASANAAQSDPNPSNNTDNTGNGGNAAAVADVSVVKTLTTTGPYVIGQVVSFNIVVTNNGPSAATGVSVTDTMTNLTQGTVSGDCTALPCTIPSIASTSSATITVTGTIQADGAFSNGAMATPTETDPVPGNNTGTAGGNTTPTADVSVVKTLTTPGPYVIGQVVSFNIVVTNNGLSTATGVSVTDTMTNLTQGAVSGDCTALPCMIPSIASGDSATITVAGTIQADGAFSNSATATPTEADPVPGNNTGTAGGNTTPTADVSAVKTLTTTGPYVIGQVVSFNIVVTNNGLSTATDVSVTDTMTNLIQGTVSGACTALPCTIASIASGDSATITVAGTIQADGAFSNSATATPTETDPVPGNNTGTAGGNTTPTADVSVVKTLTTAGPYVIGQVVSFNIVVTNNGPSAATGVQVADTMTNLTQGTVSGACTALPCTIPSIAATSSATITVTGTIQADGAFSNSATAMPTETDPVPSNNTGTAGGNTTPTADVSVVKTLTTAGPYVIGQTVSFSIVVTNNGLSTATGVSVTDTMTNLTQGTVSGACTALPCTISSIASGDSATITVAGTIQADGAFSNSATAMPTETDPVPGNNTGTAGGNTTPTADVSVVKTLTTTGPYVIGQVVSFNIAVTNNGPSVATGVQVTDSMTNLVQGTVSGACTALPCTIPSIASTSSASITVTGTIQADGAFSNSATATPTEADPVPGNNTGTAGGNTTPTADVSVVKTLTTTGPYVIGQVVSFNIVVTNNGPSAATGVQVTDTLTNLTQGTVSGACTALPCTIPSIAATSSATITVTGTIQADGAFSNSATATPIETDLVPGNNTGTAGGNTTPTADVSVVKTLTTAGPYVIGQTVSFNIVVTNNGPSAATGVSVTDTMTNLTQGTVSGACTTLPCTIPSIAATSSTTITVTGTIQADGAFSNSATATPTEADPVPGNNTGTEGGNTTPTADVSVVKTLTTAGPYVIGQTVSFNIVVTNNGPSAATGVSVTDTMTNLTQGTVSGACTALPCTIPSIAATSSATITVTGTIQADGAFSNSATATPAETDPVPGSNTGTASGNTTPTADVSVVKTLTTPGPYVIGQVVSFNIVVTNNGLSTATGVSVADTMTNLTQGIVSGACTALPCTIPSIASGDSATITVAGTIQADGAFSNSATATPVETDPVPGNNTGTAGGNTTPTADVSVVKTLTTPGPYVIGQTVSFNIVVTNNGPSAATGVQVTDTMTNLTQGAVSGACTALPCTILSIAPTSNATITVTGAIQADGAFSNSATATPTEADPVPGNNTGTAGGNTTPTADVSVIKTLTTAGPYVIGQMVSFDIVVSNAGPSAATNVQVTDTPTNLTITAVSGAGCAALPCTIVSIASSTNATVTVTGTIDADGAFGNSATATPAETDPNAGNNTSNDGDNTTPTADISVAKTLTTAGPYLAGQAVQYSIVVANNGPSTATNVQVTDTPTNIAITGVSGAGCSALPCTIASLASGANATIIVNATIGATGGAFNNSATATGTETDPSAGNNTDDDPATASALPIVANPDSATTPQNTPVTVSVLGNDTLNGVPANPTTVTVTQASPPANGSIVVNPDGTIAYTPAPGFSGTDTYSYQICEIANPANCATTTVSVTVQPNAVTAVDDSASTAANVPVTISPLANDTATGASLDPASVTITAQPAHGTVVVNPDGTVVYTPATNYLGNDTFTYQVCDTSTPTAVCDTAVVTVAVTGRPPVTGAAGDQGSGPAGQPVTIPVLANDSDPDGNLDPTSVVIVGAPGNGKSLVVPGQGTWTVNPDGSITFAPEPGFAGQATPIQYTVSDTTGLVSNPSAVNVTILGDVQLRVSKTASPRDVKIGDLVRYTVTVENVGVANATDATLTDTPPAGFSYVADSLTVVDDNSGGRLVGTYPIRVDQIDIAIGERATITYLLRVGAGVRPGVHTNRAFVQDGGATVSNQATADVQLVADPMLDESLLIGTVFDDRDGDGWQDRATLDGVRVQGGFAPGAYVAGSTTVDRGDGAKPEPDASAPLLHGIDLGKVAGRETEADTAAAHAITISQMLSAPDVADDFVLTSKQGVTLRMDAAGNTRIERSAGDAAKGLTGAEPKVERRLVQMQDGYRVDYIVSNLGVDERGIPGVRIASVEGLLIETDQYGRYHLEGVAGGPWERGRNFILKVDPATLPPGSAFTTQNPLVRRITPGVPVRFDFGVKLPPGVVEGGKQDVEMELGEVMFAPGSAELRREHQPVIDKIAEQVQRHGGGEIVIAATGDTQALAYDRARAVQDALAKSLPPELLAATKLSLRADVEDPHSALATVGGSTLLGTLLFDTDKADIRAEYRPLIEAIAADIEKRGGGTVGVVGHADRRGSDAYNVQLGLRRAKAVYEAIAAKLAPSVRARLRVEISDNPTAPVGIRGQ